MEMGNCEKKMRHDEMERGRQRWHSRFVRTQQQKKTRGSKSRSRNKTRQAFSRTKEVLLSRRREATFDQPNSHLVDKKKTKRARKWRLADPMWAAEERC